MQPCLWFAMDGKAWRLDDAITGGYSDAITPRQEVIAQALMRYVMGQTNG